MRRPATHLLGGSAFSLGPDESGWCPSAIARIPGVTISCIAGGQVLDHGQPESYPGTYPKTALRRDYVRFADDSYSIRLNHLKRLALLEICRVKRDCSYLPTGTLRRTSSGTRTLSKPSVEKFQLVVGGIEEYDAHANSLVGIDDLSLAYKAYVIAGDDYAEKAT